MTETTTTVECTDFRSDIPQALALAAHSGTSFVPDKRAKSERDDYSRTLADDYEQFRELAEKCGTLDRLEEEFSRYREGFRRRYTAWLSSRSRLVSTMIAGPANFPAARMNKRGEVSHKRLTDLLEYRQKARGRVFRAINPQAAPVMAGDSDAVERLEAKIAKAEQRQEASKAANKIIRQKPRNEQTPGKMVALMELGFTHEQSEQLFVPNCFGQVGIADFSLKNNNANIRRMKQRLEQVRRAKATPDTEQTGENARLEDCPSDNRVRLFFSGKPAADVRSDLKSCGFRWAPSLGCWQAYRNHRSLTAAGRLAGIESEGNR